MYALCGISNCFRLLFHTQRQIAYALLTRPPLAVSLRLVRLECVRHAASVHPEPGSNSLVFIINRRSRRVYASLPERCFLLFYFFEFFKVSFRDSLHFTFVSLPSFSVLEILLFNFQRSCARPLRDLPSLSGRAFLFYYLLPFLSSGFFNFFRFSKKIRGKTANYLAAFPCFLIKNRGFSPAKALVRRIFL